MTKINIPRALNDALFSLSFHFVFIFFFFSSYKCICSMDQMFSQSSWDNCVTQKHSDAHICTSHTYTYVHMFIFMLQRTDALFQSIKLFPFSQGKKIENIISIESYPWASPNPDMSFPVSVFSQKYNQVVSIEPWLQPIQNVWRLMILLCVFIHARTRACVYPCMWLCEYSFQKPQAVDTALV